jgi:hypothetical protein
LVLRPKPRNRHCDFDAQITKPELPILRHNPGNPPPPWFWGSTKKPTTGFEVKLGETIATSFEAKLEKIVATGFEVKLAKTVVPPPVFRPDWETLSRLASTPSKLPDLNACPAPTSLSQFCETTNKLKPAWFWGPNQETVAVIFMPNFLNQSCWF